MEYFVSYYDYYQPEAYVPSLGHLFIEKDSSINEHIEQMRLSATKALLERPDAIIVGTVSSIYGLGDPGVLPEDGPASCAPATRSETSARSWRGWWPPAVHPQRHGFPARRLFRVRGDVIDIFPAECAELALRVELFDDEVESLSVFDPLTGEVIRKLPRFTFYPKSHYVTPRETVLGAIETIKDELSERLDQALRRRQQAGGSAAPGAAHPLRPGDDARTGLLQRHRELLALSLRAGGPASRRRRCMTTCRPTRCW